MKVGEDVVTLEGKGVAWIWRLTQGSCRDRVKGDIRGNAGEGNVRKHGSKRQGSSIDGIDKAEAIKRDGREEADERSKFSEGAGRAARGANLKKNVATGKGGSHEARKRVRGGPHRTDTREEDEKMTRGKMAGCNIRGWGGRPRPNKDMGGRRGSEAGANGDDGLDAGGRTGA